MPRSSANPFIYGGPVDTETFIGRENEVRLVFEQVTNQAHGCVAVIGERRIGKTSLLHYIAAPDVARKWNLDQQSSIFLFVDCGGIAPLSITRFWQDILARLHRELIRRSGSQKLIDSVSAMLTRAEIKTTDIEFLLEDLDAENLLVVVLLDEFEWIVRTDPQHEEETRQLLGGLRALINHASRSLCLIVATRRPLDHVCRDLRFMGSPFYNNFVFVHLRPFTRTEADSLLEQMLKNTGVTFTPEERRFIDDLAGTHPLLLQAAAACTYDVKISGGSTALDRRMVLQRFMDLTAHQWQDLWRWSTADEQRTLIILAQDQHAATATLSTQASLKRSLLQRGLIVEDGSDYRLFSPMLRDWILEHAHEIAAPLRTTQGRRSPSPPAPVFISYSHKDEAEKNALLTHLGVLEGAQLIEVWSDDQIAGGEAWEAAIDHAIGRARAAVLLVTANLLTSQFVLKREVPELLKRRAAEGVSVIPVIAKACAWKQVDWLARMNVRPRNGTPVWSSGSDPDAALATIAEEIARVVQRGQVVDA